MRFGGGPSDSGGHPTGIYHGRLGAPRRPSLFRSADLDPESGAEPKGSAMQHLSYETKGGIRVERKIKPRQYSPADTTLADRLDTRRGVLFSSSFEFPGRYTRWDMGFVDPPLSLIATGRNVTIEALNARGQVLIVPIAAALGALPELTIERS